MKKIYFSGVEYFNDNIFHIPLHYRERVWEAFDALKPTIFNSIDDKDVKVINHILRLQRVFANVCTWIEFNAEQRTFSGTAMWTYFESLKAIEYDDLFIKTEGVLYSKDAFINCNEGLPVSILEKMWHDCMVDVSPSTLVHKRNILIEHGIEALKDREEIAIYYMREMGPEIKFSDFKNNFSSNEFEYWLKF